MCPSCGARLRSKAAASAPKAARAAEASAKAPEERPRKQAAAAVIDNPNATLPPGTPLIPIPKPGSTPLDELEGLVPPAPAAPASSGVSLESLLEEVRALRRTQEEILALLRDRPERPEGGADRDDPFGGFGQETPISMRAVEPAPVRSRRRKSVLLLDDDPTARQAVIGALERAEVPVRAFGDGNAGLQALAEERSDVLVLELGMGGAMAGKDVVNVIKATMEWVDIPIILYTRVPVQGQKEARQIHGADELVQKGPGSEEMLVSRVIQFFRRP